MQSEKRTILLVEDNQDDVELTRVAFSRALISNPIVVVNDGAEALDFLLKRGAYVYRTKDSDPIVILLDLNLPRVNGFEVMDEMAKHEHLKYIPVIVLTTSTEVEDKLHAYKSGCNSYVRKPVSFTDFVEVSRNIGLYWLLYNEPVE